VVELLGFVVEIGLDELFENVRVDVGQIGCHFAARSSVQGGEQLTYNSLRPDQVCVLGLQIAISASPAGQCGKTGWRLRTTAR